MLFQSILEVLDESVQILRCVDKLRKIGEDKVREQLIDLIDSEDKANAILSYITKKENESFLETVDRLASLAGGEAVHSLKNEKIFSYLEAASISEHFYF